MHGIKLACFLFSELCLLKGYNAKTTFNNLVQNCTCMPVLHGIRFNHGKSSVAHRSIFTVCFKIGRKDREVGLYRAKFMMVRTETEVNVWAEFVSVLLVKE
jgi:hypothetical protein